MSNWEIPPIKNSAETSSEQYRGRVEVVKRLIDALGADYVKSGSYVDKFEGIELSKECTVRVVLGLPGYMRNPAIQPNELLRVYRQNNDGSETAIAWESLSVGDKYEILRTAYPAGDANGILGE